ncbi:MAG: AbrB/MazE/SpoVT family DNA-binding domain-containing protein [Enhydrobacter sp.]|nr:AbrB/MazE/SpoVT family DNA-binding domain-containing protein [Enhydrobacter sp.]
MSTKGQVVLPKAIRDKHAWKGGTRLIVEDRPDGVLLKPVEEKKKFTIDDFAGIVKYKGPPKSVEDMNAAIEEEFKARHARGRY